MVCFGIILFSASALVLGASGQYIQYTSVPQCSSPVVPATVTTTNVISSSFPGLVNPAIPTVNEIVSPSLSFTEFIPAFGKNQCSSPIIINSGLPGPVISTGFTETLSGGYTEVTGQLPITGTVRVTGTMPVYGLAVIEGDVPTYGVANLASGCGCNDVSFKILGY